MDWKDALMNFAADNSLPPGKPDEPSAPAPRPRLNPRIDIERKGRGGKVATIVSGICPPLSPEEVAQLGSRLKQSLAVGGAVCDGEILLQGRFDRDRIINLINTLTSNA